MREDEPPVNFGPLLLPVDELPVDVRPLLPLIIAYEEPPVRCRTPAAAC